MTSTITGLPERYRPHEQVGPDEPTATGVIRSWRATDRVLNRDVAIRVHTPAGPAAHAWITRALTAGGLATPALAMVYDASEGAEGPDDRGSAAYVVNEWIDGQTLTERLRQGPLPERETRLILRRLAEGVAEAHRAGLAVGGLTTDNVVLRPNGLVGLRAVPAATGTMDGDVLALGELLEACLTGRPPGSGAPGQPAAPAALSGPPDLVALARRARSTDPAQGLSSVAAMAALLAERPRTGPSHSLPLGRGDDSDSGWLRRLRERRPEPGRPGASSSRYTRPPVPGAPAGAPPAAGDTVDVSTVPPAEVPATYYGRHAPGETSDDALGVLDDDGDLLAGGYDGGYATADGAEPRPDDDEATTARRRLLVVGLPLLALAVVIAIALYVGNSLLDVAGSVDKVEGSTPTAGAPAGDEGEQGGQDEQAAGEPVQIVSGTVFDPFGDGEPENDRDVPLSHDGDPATSWSTLEYRGSPAFGNLKPGVGIVFDLGEEQTLSGVTLTTTTPGIGVEIRAGDAPDGTLDSFDVVSPGAELEKTTDLTFEKPVTTRFLLVWVTGLVPSAGGFSGDLAEVVPHGAA